MASFATQALGGPRNDRMLAIPITIPGLDISVLVARAQIRTTADNPVLLLDVKPTDSATATGIRTLPITTDAAGIKTSHLLFQVAKADMQGLPFAGEVGDPWVGAYGFQIDGITRMEGSFVALASAIDSDNAPTNRPGGSSGASGTVANGVVLTIGDAGVTLSIVGLDLTAVSAAAAKAAEVAAIAAQHAAEVARDQANGYSTALAPLIGALARPRLVRNALIALVDRFGRAAVRELGDGSIAIHRLVRDDGTDVYAQIDAALAGGAGAKSVNTLALMNAARTLGSFPALAAKAADAATVTLGAGDAASAITNSTEVASGKNGVLQAPFTPRFGVPRAINGATDDTFGGWMYAKGAYRNTGSDGTIYYGASSSGFEWLHTGTEFEPHLIGNGDANRAARLLVNDRVVWSGAISNDSKGHLLHTVFSSAATRRISLETANTSFLGVRIGAGDTLAQVAFTRPWLSIIGDSFGDETGATSACMGLAMTLGRALGCAVNNVSVGSTGIIGAGNAVAYVNARRIADLTMAGSGYSPAIGVILGTQNDNIAKAAWQTYGSTLELAIANGSATLIEAWIAANAGKPLILVAPWVVNGLDTYPPSIEIMQIRDGMQKAAWQYRSSNVHFIDQLDRSLMPGVASGDAAALPAAYYSTTYDHLHPSQAGHDMRGLWLAKQIETLVMGTLA